MRLIALASSILIGCAGVAHTAGMPVAPLPPAVTAPDFDAAWRSAPCGSTITLAPQIFGPLTPSARPACPGSPLTLNAKGATLVNWSFRSVVGLVINGATIKNRASAAGWTTAMSFAGSAATDGSPGADCGQISINAATVIGPYAATAGQPYQPGAGYGLSFMRCQDIAVTNSSLRGFGQGLLFGLSSRIVVDNVECAFNSADCINLGQVWGAKISRVYCHATLVLPAVHPDCVQAYSRFFYPNSLTPAPPTSDLVITNNVAIGQMQGVFLGNHVRTYNDGKAHDDGGFARVLIEGNFVAMTGGNAIRADGAVDIKVTNNRVETLPGSPFMANVQLSVSPTARRCGNTIGGFGARAPAVDAACVP